MISVVPYPPGPSDYVHRALGPKLIGRYGGGSRVVLVFAEPRAWKGRSGFGAAAKEALAHHAAGADLIVLFGHPRLAAGTAKQSAGSTGLASAAAHAGGRSQMARRLGYRRIHHRASSWLCLLL